MGPRLRVAIWAGVGALIALLWNFAYVPKLTKTALFLADLSCPIVLFARDHSISLFTGLAVNTAMYALTGLLLEMARKKLNASTTVSG